MSGVQTQLFSPNIFVDITSVADKKLEAAYAHKSQFIEQDDVMTLWHIPMQKFRGLESKSIHAEAFVKQTPQKSEIAF